MPVVGRTARLLGLAGLLPQVAAVLLMLLAGRSRSDLGGILALTGYWLALVYAALILSFLGGIWWGFAMRRVDGQGRLAAMAVVPSLIAFAALIAAAWSLPHAPSPWPAIVLGGAVLLTLTIDRRLAATGEAPAGWMPLRMPLSLGLGGLTIAAGILLAMGLR